MKIRDRIKRLDRVKASELLPNPRNWRTHPQAQQDALRGVLAEVGWVDALLVRETPAGLQIVDGHMRAETTPDEEVPVLVLDLDDAEADKVLATFDPIAGMAESDPLKLDALLREIDTGSEALQQMLADLAEEAGLYQDEQKTDVDAEAQIDKAEELRVKWGVEKGQLWLLGEHRLLCGDSTKAEDVERVMQGERAFLMATDPPYGVDFSGAKYNPRAKAWKGIDGDKVQGEDLRQFVKTFLESWFPHMEEVSAFYLWTAAMTEGAAAAAGISDAGLHIQSQIIWKKNCLVLGQADYHWMHENCWYAFWKGKKHRWYGERDKTTVWECDKVANASYVHPMQKPTELYATSIRHHTNEGECCAEPFSGSGSQIIACEQLNRRCRAIEISPAYVAVALQRYQDATGKTPTLAK